MLVPCENIVAGTCSVRNVDIDAEDSPDMSMVWSRETIDTDAASGAILLVEIMDR